MANSIICTRCGRPERSTDVADCYQCETGPYCKRCMVAHVCEGEAYEQKRTELLLRTRGYHWFR